MNIYNSIQWINDLDHIIRDLPELRKLSGKKVLITGATGLIGSALTDTFIRYSEMSVVPIEIYAAGRSAQKTRSRFCEFADKSYFHCVEYDATNPDFDYPVNIDYIIHGASISSPNRLLLEPVETMLANIMGTCALLEFSRKHGQPRLLFISSSEIYGKKTDSIPYKESQYGGIDTLNVRNAYANSKRAAEALCISYAEEFGMDVVIARPGHVFGPTAKSDDMHVSSSWLRAAAKKEPIIIKSEGNQLRSYCYCLDVSAALVKILIKGESGHAYNISDTGSLITIKNMAEMIAELSGVRLVSTFATDKEKSIFNPMMISALDGSELRKLGWRASFDLKTSFAHTMKIIDDENDSAICSHATQTDDVEWN